MKDLKNSVVLITGAGGGIGKACAFRFADEGCRLVLCDINNKQLNSVADELKTSDVEVIAKQVDVSKEEDVRKLLLAIKKKYEKVDVIICNAGIGWTGPTHLMKKEDWEKVLGVNFYGVVHFIQQFVPSMTKVKRGHVVIVSSIFGITGLPFGALYAASKAGLIALGECLRSELKQYNIGVTTICPGLIETGLIKNTHFNEVDEKARELPLKIPAMSAEKCADKIIRSVKKNKGVVVITLVAKILWFMKRFSQNLYQLFSFFVARSTSKYVKN